MAIFVVIVIIIAPSMTFAIGAINAGSPEIQLTTFFVLVLREDVSTDDTASLKISAAAEIGCVIGAS
jgi:ABC-type uncharacterized transport system permease subunit